MKIKNIAVFAVAGIAVIALVMAMAFGDDKKPANTNSYIEPSSTVTSSEDSSQETSSEDTSSEETSSAESSKETSSKETSSKETSSKESKIKMLLMRTREKFKVFLESEGFIV